MTKDRPVAPSPEVAGETELLSHAAARAMGARDFAAACDLLRKATAFAPSDVVLWLNLAAALRAMGGLADALGAVDRALAAAPRDFMALLMRASLLERLHGERVAGPVYGAALVNAPDADRLDASTRRALDHGREVNLRYGMDLNTVLRTCLDGLAPASTVARQGAAFIDLLTGRRRRYQQQPLGYFYPGLPAIAFWERDYFPWLAGLEAQADAIRAEMSAVGFDDSALVPYIDLPAHEPVDQWEDLNRSPRWTAFHLLQHGRRIDANVERCHATMAALTEIPQPVAPNRSPSAMFSVLQPGARIPPHTGVSNTRLVAHLALSVPEGCGFRVGAETRDWREGEAFVFDDTIEHEAWNESEAPRAVLIFDVWNPLIGEAEREVIGRIMAAMDAFNDKDAAEGDVTTRS